MSRLWIAIRLLFCIPAMWFAVVVVGWFILISGREPIVDIALYAVERLAH